MKVIYWKIVEQSCKTLCKSTIQTKETMNAQNKKETYYAVKAYCCLRLHET